MGSKKGHRTAVHGTLSAISTGARKASGPARPPSGGRVGASKLALRAISAILVSSMGAGTALATDAALPDNALYGMKTATEQLRLGFARSPEQQVAVLLDIADARLREAVALESTARHAEAGAAVSAYGEHVARAAAQLQAGSAAAVPASLERFRTEVAKQQATAETSRDAGASKQDALSFVADMGTILGRTNAAAPHEIAAAAANAAQRAAVRVEQTASSVTTAPAREQTGTVATTATTFLPLEHRISAAPATAAVRMARETEPPATLQPASVSVAAPAAAVVAASAVVTTPAVTTPAVTTPAVTTPAVTTPAVTTPAVTTPAVATPAVSTPATTTAAAMPAATTSAATTPGAQTSETTTPPATTATITASSIAPTAPTSAAAAPLAAPASSGPAEAPASRAPAAPAPATPRAAASEPPAVRPAATTNETKKHEAVAKAARESAERAKAAADQAKSAADKGNGAKSQAR